MTAPVEHGKGNGQRAMSTAGFLQFRVESQVLLESAAAIHSKVKTQLQDYQRRHWRGHLGNFAPGSPANKEPCWSATVKTARRNGKQSFTGERLTRACDATESALAEALVKCASETMGKTLVFMHAVILVAPDAETGAGPGAMHWDHDQSGIKWSNGQAPAHAGQPLSLLLALGPTDVGTVVIQGSHVGGHGGMGAVKELLQEPGLVLLMDSTLLHTTLRVPKGTSSMRAILFAYALDEATLQATDTEAPWSDVVHWSAVNPTVCGSGPHPIFYDHGGTVGSVQGSHHESIQTVVDRILAAVNDSNARVDPGGLKNHNGTQIGNAGAGAQRPIKVNTT
jgi:hypothetical protein